MTDATKPATFVLVHGAWSGGWGLTPVAERMRRRGHRVYTPTLTGLGERVHLSSGAVNLSTHIEDICNVIKYERLKNFVLAGHSYGGRQASLLAADEPAIAAALLLFSYPLHPPAKPLQLRTQHFPNLRVPTTFVHGTADPFGSLAELEAAIAAIPAPTDIIPIEKAGHDLKRGRFDLAALAQRFSSSFAKGPAA